MTRLRNLLVAALILGTPAGVKAAPLEFSFSFVNLANGGGTVTGIVRGLADDATSEATSVIVTGNTAGFGLGEYVGFTLPNPFNVYNSWTVSAGSITSVFFRSFGVLNSPPAVQCCSLNIQVNAPQVGNPAVLVNLVGLTPQSNIVSSSNEVVVTFRRLDPPIGVPAPSPGLLLASAIGALGLMLRPRGG